VGFLALVYLDNTCWSNILPESSAGPLFLTPPIEFTFLIPFYQIGILVSIFLFFYSDSKHYLQLLSPDPLSLYTLYLIHYLLTNYIIKYIIYIKVIKRRSKKKEERREGWYFYQNHFYQDRGKIKAIFAN
jgi:hypothetical protein